MPRITTVEKARQDQGNCGRCGKEIKAGDGYRWIKFRHGGRHIRCLESGCAFRSSELTQSKMSEAYAAQEDAQDALTTWDGEELSDLQDIAQEAADAIRSVAEEYQSSADAIHDNFSESSTADECEEKSQELEGWADEIESAGEDLEDFEPVEPECPNCGSSMIKDEGTGTWKCNDDNGAGCTVSNFEPEGELLDESGQTRTDWTEACRDAVQTAIDNCPC
jgi:ribosomal protein L37AE/L43A